MLGCLLSPCLQTAKWIAKLRGYGLCISERQQKQKKKRGSKIINESEKSEGRGNRESGMKDEVRCTISKLD